MKTIYALAFAVMLAAAPFSFAVDAAPHEDHHPDAAAAKAGTNKMAKSPGATKKAANEQKRKMEVNSHLPF